MLCFLPKATFLSQSLVGVLVVVVFVVVGVVVMVVVVGVMVMVVVYLH